MKKAKKFTAIALIASVFALPLISCGKKEEKSEKNNTNLNGTTNNSNQQQNKFVTEQSKNDQLNRSNTSGNNINNGTENNIKETNTKGSTKMVHLTAAEFKQKVFNYETQKEWKFTGNVPVIIDFYADWCGPCKMVAPVLEELSKEYDGKVQIYKVDTESEQELAQVFGIRSIPSILFIPMEGKPQMSMGALPKESFVKAINEILLVN